MSDSTETPWALVQRMRSEGAGLGPIVAALQARGLAREDVEVLLEGAPELTASRDAGTKRAAGLKRRPPDVLEPVDFSVVLPWSGVVGALIAGLIGAALGGPGGWAAAGVALLVGGAVVRSQLRRSVQRSLRALGFVVCGTMGLAALSGGLTGNFTAFHAGTAALAVGGVSLLAYSYTRRDPLKGVRDFSRGLTVYEDNDVQFVVKLPDRPTLGPGELFEVVVTAQCCVDAPRELVVEIDADTQSIDGERLHRFALQPGEVVELTIPVQVGALPPPFADVNVVLSGFGNGGERVQLSSGATWVNPRRALLSNLAGGFELMVEQEADFQLSHDGHLRLRIDASRPVATASREVRRRGLFTPTADELAKAAKT